MGRCNSGDLFRSSFRHDLPAPGTPFGAEVDDPVCGFDDIQVVFNDHQRIAGIHEFVKDSEELLDVLKMQTGRWLIHDIEHIFGGSALQLGGDFQALGFAA